MNSRELEVLMIIASMQPPSLFAVATIACRSVTAFVGIRMTGRATLFHKLCEDVPTFTMSRVSPVGLRSFYMTGGAGNLEMLAFQGKCCCVMTEMGGRQESVNRVAGAARFVIKVFMKHLGMFVDMAFRATLVRIAVEEKAAGGLRGMGRQGARGFQVTFSTVPGDFLMSAGQFERRGMVIERFAVREVRRGMAG